MDAHAGELSRALVSSDGIDGAAEGRRPDLRLQEGGLDGAVRPAEAPGEPRQQGLGREGQVFEPAPEAPVAQERGRLAVLDGADDPR